MLCNNCKKLALFPKMHGCINCPRFCDSAEMKFCSYCSEVKNICAICGKAVQSINVEGQQLKADLDEQVKKIHPFYKSGCRNCGGGR